MVFFLVTSEHKGKDDLGGTIKESSTQKYVGERLILNVVYLLMSESLSPRVSYMSDEIDSPGKINESST